MGLITLAEYKRSSKCWNYMLNKLDTNTWSVAYKKRRVAKHKSYVKYWSGVQMNQVPVITWSLRGWDREGKFSLGYKEKALVRCFLAGFEP